MLLRCLYCMQSGDLLKGQRGLCYAYGILMFKPTSAPSFGENIHIPYLNQTSGLKVDGLDIHLKVVGTMA